MAKPKLGGKETTAFEESVTLGGQHRSGDGARQVVGDRMQGRLRHVNQGDLPDTRLVFMFREGPKSQSGRSQSTHRSEEVLETGWSKGVQEGEYARLRANEGKPATVSKETKQAGEAKSHRWEWVERSIWTERMLEALENGVKGGIWFSLIDKVYRPDTLKRAWQRVKANGGSAGSDHQSIKGFERHEEENLEKLRQELQKGTYRPRPIRREYIPKAGSREKRPLGIPAVRDRVVQTAVQMVIEPIFERAFLEYSFGFRPGRGCKDALKEVDLLLKAGYTWVLDADIKAYFDSIDHDLLMEELRTYIGDGRILRLIEMFLKQEITEALKLWEPEAGTPQGAVISPLLANVYLHPVDGAMERAGYRMIRYADDFVIMCRSKEEAERAREAVQRLIEARGLSLHEGKTQVVDATMPGGFDFLGYHFERTMRWPRKKSLKKFKDTIRQKTKRCNGRSMERVIASINRTIRGWFEYFKHSHRTTFTPLDGWIRRRLRSILRKRKKLSGISRGRDHQRWPNSYFRDLGLFNLEEAHRDLLQSLKG
jgi:RNA-directed DNA polymerase